MSLKKLGVALLVVFMLGAIAANSAFAENEWRSENEKGQWYTGASPGTKLAVGAEKSITVSGGAANLTSTIAGSAIRFDSTSATGEGCSFKQAATTTATLDCNFLVFKGVTVSGPAATGCSTPTEIKTTTKGLTGILGMNKAGTVATIKITPKEGSTFATVELTGTCANAGLYKVTGTVYAQATNATGVFSKTQELTVSEAIQKSAGTATSLKFGENGAFINGGLKGVAEVEWAGKES
jgi:hypothetical protein